MYVLEYGKHAPVFVSEGKLYSLKYVRGHNMPIMYAHSLARLGMCCQYSSPTLLTWFHNCQNSAAIVVLWCLRMVGVCVLPCIASYAAKLATDV